MPAARIKQFLDQQGVSYSSIPHAEAATAQETAAAAHVPGREVAKTVMVKLDGALAMAVLPAPQRLDTERLKRAAGAANVELAAEADFQKAFPDCEPGAMPPFGNLYDMQVFVDRALAEDEQIAFNAGTHTELLQVPYRDFERLVSPVVADLSG